MDRKRFLTASGIASLALFIPSTLESMTDTPKKLYFEDDGKIPNNELPLILYKDVFEARGVDGASWLERQFSSNNWTNSWRNGIYSFHHYHSTSHEVLGIYSGKALVHLGGENGQKVNIAAGDIIIIPAGVGHKNLKSDNLGVVGAYPDGRTWDLNRGLPNERPQTDKNIAALPLPSADPLLGKNDGIRKLWIKQ
jgi:uncharacterized protein YjlB